MISVKRPEVKTMTEQYQGYLICGVRFLARRIPPIGPCLSQSLSIIQKESY
jgi:hypothetical protein